MRKLIVLILCLLILININEAKADRIKEVKIDNKTIFSQAEYKPEDFYGNWLNTGIIRFDCSTERPRDNESIDMYRFFTQDVPEDGISDTTRFDIIFKPNEKYYNIDSSTMYYKYFRAQPKIYIYVANLGVCGSRTILTVQYGDEKIKAAMANKWRGQDSYIIINKNKMLLQTGYGFYSIYERVETVTKDRKFDLYMYNQNKDDENVNVYKDDPEFAIHFRPWVPNENILDVIK
ncbi:hypothetical protein ACFX5K_03200 [Rickettsiales bacterium LUAb2]